MRHQAEVRDRGGRGDGAQRGQVPDDSGREAASHLAQAPRPSLVMGRGRSVVSPKAQVDVHSVPGAVGIRDRRKAGATAATAGSLANELARDRGVVAGSERVAWNGRELELVSTELRQERLERAAGHPERRRHLPRKGLGGAERVEREEGARLVPLEEELVLECDKQGQAGLGAERLESALQERSRARAPVASVNLDRIG